MARGASHRPTSMEMAASGKSKSVAVVAPREKASMPIPLSSSTTLSARRVGHRT